MEQNNECRGKKIIIRVSEIFTKNQNFFSIYMLSPFYKNYDKNRNRFLTVKR